ncbi:MULTISPECIES: asparagine synthase-related protein [Vibrio]|uniref:asparagine synthase-related protein n=1 Tax=Vibrio TaxID=662 RepID=UPI00028C0289|nr:MULTISPECIES: asparagine synthase-related protein [Vibrio]EKM21631.1 asparagine synthase family protein [Vibrio sp. HENC-03]HDM8209022.1 asparagine synthase [Vibrio campbellii]
MLINIKKTSQTGLESNIEFNNKVFYYHVFGSLYLENEAEVIKSILDDNQEYLRKLVGNFTVVVLDPISGQVKIVSDRPGKQNIFYHMGSQGLTISDDFWEIKEALSLSIDDVDRMAIKQQLVFFTGLNGRTLFKEVKSVPAASILKFKLDDLNVTIKRYWQFSYNENQLSYDDKLDLIDQTFTNALGTIKKLNPQEESFAVGVSGGLDSRIIPYYATKNGMNIEGFTIGIERPRKLFLSNDFNSANKIASHFGIERRTLQYNSISFEEQLQMETRLAPEVGSQMFKIVDVGQLKSNILITGASGFVIGASPMYSSMKQSPLVDHTLLYQSLLGTKPRAAKVKKAISSLTGASLSFKPQLNMTGFGSFFTKEEVDECIADIEQFYSDLGPLSKSEKLMNYAIFGVGRNNAKGAFESFLGQKESYSIYTPFFLDTVQQFSEDELLNRQLFQEFIAKRLPELAAIQGQDFKPTLLGENSALTSLSRKLLAMGNFVIRGNGVMNYENWVKSREFKELKLRVDHEAKPILTALGVNFDYGEHRVHSALQQNILKMQNILTKI